MMTTLQQTASNRPTAQDTAMYSPPPLRDARGAHRARSLGPQRSLVERVRTFIDRTLDAAFGRFDH